MVYELKLECTLTDTEERHHQKTDLGSWPQFHMVNQMLLILLELW